MYSSSPQPAHYCDTHGKHDPSTHTSLGRYGHDASNPNQTGENHHMTTDAPGPPSSWHNDYSLESPTSATSPPFSMQHNYPSMLTPPPSTSTPYVLSHSTDNGAAASTMDSGPHGPGNLSYGYGLSHRGFFPRPKLTTTLWEDERTICFQVDANGICVARREDNDMINGTKLLNVAGMSRGKRDGILKNEKGRVVVKVGAMHLKGVWVTFDRAKALAAQFKIQTTLYPLFVDNPQSFLYSHPITSPISRLGSFRPFYPSSYDHVLSSSSSASSTTVVPPVEHHHGGVDHSSPSNAATPASFGYRPGSTPGPPALPPQSTSSYGGIQTYTNDMNSGGSGGSDGNNDLLAMEYRSGGSTLDSLTNPQGGPTTPTHESPYYNHLLDSTPRSSNEMPFHDANNKDKMMISTALSGPSDNNNNNNNNSHSSFLENQHGRDISKRSSSSGVPLPSSSAFQPLDTTLPPAFHHPQPIYTGTNSRDHHHYYHHQQMQPSPTSASSTQHYFANPLSAGSSSSSSSTSILNNHPCTTATTATDLPPDNNNNNNNKDHRRDSLVMTRNNAHQRHHHPYANPLSPPPPKLPPHHHHPYLNNSVTLKKPPSGGARHVSSQNLVKEMDPLSVKTEPDYLGRPW